MSLPVPEISVEEFREKRDRVEQVVLLDVREPHEWAISDLPGSVKIPLGKVREKLEELSREDEIIVYCRTGGRSANAVALLRQMGYAKAKNLIGGINRWAEVIDPTMRKY